jgi:hypothetical protein
VLARVGYSVDKVTRPERQQSLLHQSFDLLADRFQRVAFDAKLLGDHFRLHRPIVGVIHVRQNVVAAIGHEIRYLFVKLLNDDDATSTTPGRQFFHFVVFVVPLS